MIMILIMTNSFDVYVGVLLVQLFGNSDKSRKIINEINLHSMFQSYLESISAGV